jgi:hypothetical protein
MAETTGKRLFVVCMFTPPVTWAGGGTSIPVSGQNRVAPRITTEDRTPQLPFGRV